MTEAGWTRNKDAAESYADKAAIEAVRHVLGAHKLTCDEHENLQQDFKDVAQEAYQQGRAAGARDYRDAIIKELDLDNSKQQEFTRTDVILVLAHADDTLAQQAQGEKVVE